MIMSFVMVFAVNIPDKTMDTSDSKQVVMNVYDPGH
jgi:hypothetical protein